MALNSHKCIIYLNGTFPTLGGLGSLNTDVPIIACDGAVHKMHTWPTYVLGDLDSIDGTKPQCTVIERMDQDYTDFEKALMFAREEKLTPALVLGVNGGEIDHIIGNMQVISKYADTIPSYFLDFYDGGVKLGMPLIPHRRISTIPGSLISIIPFEKTHLTTKGLKWELKDQELHCNGILGLRNEAAKRNVVIDVKSGSGIIIMDATPFVEINASL